MKKDTLVTSSGRHPEDNHGVVNPPVYHASTITFPTLSDFQNRVNDPYSRPQYGRTGTPTQFAFEEAITALHGGVKTVSYPSGLAAIVGAATTFLESGDNILMADTVYGPVVYGLPVPYSNALVFRQPSLIRHLARKLRI